jgi:hypothetical protein
MIGLVVALLTIQGCKVRIIAPEGGDIITKSGSYECLSGKSCNIDVLDFFFDETFIARPSEGYKFRFWKKGPNRLCGWLKEPCHIHTIGFEENAELAEVIRSFLESDEIFYLQPVFEPASEADLYVGVSDYSNSYKYCNREGRVWYSIEVANYGPAAIANDVAINIEEELYNLPGLPAVAAENGCTVQPGLISCHLGDISHVANPFNYPKGRLGIAFRPDWFRNTKSRNYRLKITVSSSTEDPDVSNNIQYFTRSLPAYPRNNGLCSYWELLERM